MPRFFRGLLALALAFAALGPIAGLFVGALPGVDGGTQATLLIGQSPIAGLIAGIAAFGVAAVAGGIGSKAAGLNVGLACAGLTLSWAAWLSGRLDEIVLVSRVSPMPGLVIEGLFVMLLLAGVLYIVRRYSISEPDPESEGGASAIAISLTIGLAMSAVAAWLLAVEPLKGQTIGAAFVAGLVGAATARLVFLRLPGWTAAAIPAALAILGPLATHAIAGDVVADVFDRSLFRLGWLLPLDWAAGALTGIPIGLAWTDNVVQQTRGPDSGPQSAPQSDPHSGPQNPAA